MMMPSMSSTPAALEEDTPNTPVKSTEMNVSVEDSDDEDPDKEYASTPGAESVEPAETSEPSETAEVVETTGTPAPVKRRPRVVKKD
jgi:hypothetical protein